MSKFIRKKIKIPNQNAFDFIFNLTKAKHDFTAAKPLVFKNKIPQKILNSLNLDYIDLFTPKLGNNYGNESVIEQCVKFFQKKNIKCGNKNISLVPDIFTGINMTYDIIDAGHSKKILIPTPTFGYYFKQFQNYGINYEIIETQKKDGFLLDPKIIEEKTKGQNGKYVLLLCYPNNPTGVVMTKQNALEISEIARKNDIFVISDEVFMDNMLGSKQHFPISSIDGMLENSITFFGLSKKFLPGIRTGICCGSEEIINQIGNVGGYSNQNLISAVLEENKENEEYFEECKIGVLQNINLIKRKIDEVNQKFCEIFDEEKTGDEAYIKPYIQNPESGLVYLIDFSGLKEKIYDGKKIESSLDIAQWLYQEASVSTIPGECFMFDPQEMVVRISLGEDQKKYEEAFESIKKAVGEIRDQ